MKRKMQNRAQRAAAAFGIARRAVTTGVVLGSVMAGQAFAALDTVSFDTEVTAVKTDISYVGSAFLFVSIAVAVWAWLRRAAK